MKTIIGLLAIILFLAGSYFSGNYALETFKEDLRERVYSSIFGVAIMLMFCLVVGLMYALFVGVASIL